MIHDAIRPRSPRRMLLVAAGALLATTTAFAQDGGQVLPSTAKPHGISLSEMAELTGPSKTGTRDPSRVRGAPRQGGRPLRGFAAAPRGS